MGMSSSQARLLSLTARQHNIELKTQRLQADKLRMANESDYAYKTYLNALNATKTNALITLEDGTIGDTLLTANKIFTYDTLSKQYSLKTQDGKTLVSSTQNNAYKSTASLSEFLNHFGLISDVEYTVPNIIKNPDYENAVKDWEKDHADWEIDHENWQNEKEQWIEDYEYWEDVEYPTWEAKEPDPNDPKYYNTTENLGDKFIQAGSSCYNSAKTGDAGCYLHILAHIIDYSEGKGYSSTSSNYVDSSWYDGTKNNYTTSTGNSFTITSSDITGAGMHSGSTNGETNASIMADVSKKIDDEETYKVAVQAGETCDVTESSSIGEKLLSKWNPDGTVKSIKQWAIDLAYLCDGITNRYDPQYLHLGITKEQMIQSVIDFQEGLAGSMSFNQTLYDQDLKAWKASEPQAPTLREEPIEPQLEDYINGIPPEIDLGDKTIQTTTFTNKNEAQWYINQWYKMEGIDEIPEIKDEKVFDTTSNKYIHIYSIENVNKSNTTYTTNEYLGTDENENYVVLQDDMLDNNVWLHNVLNEGFVQIQVFDDYTNKFIDTSTTVDTRLEVIPDEEEIKKAEATYEARLKEINRKESRTDEELSKLEAERTAIKTQQDDLKKIIQDNVDLSFKLFS